MELLLEKQKVNVRFCQLSEFKVSLPPRKLCRIFAIVDLS